MTESWHWLAPLNAVLNGCATLLLAAGFVFIKRRNVAAHRACMLSAMLMSALFLASYLTYHYEVGNVRFSGAGPVRALYFAILIPHVILAGVIVPLALTTIYFALRGNFARHRKIARWTWPLWMYVSVTGVIIYFMLYRLYTPLYPSFTAVASAVSGDDQGSSKNEDLASRGDRAKDPGFFATATSPLNDSGQHPPPETPLQNDAAGKSAGGDFRSKRVR